MAYNNRSLGSTHEAKALEFLLNKNWKLLEKNYACRLGEIDLIFKNENAEIVFVEVKYRSSLEYGLPQAAVNRKKIDHVTRAAMAYIKEKNLQGMNFRFDVVAITPTTIEHIPNAFCGFSAIL